MISALLVAPGCLGQSASDLTNADPNASYYALKRALQIFYDEGVLPSNISKGGLPSEQGYDVIDCQSGSDFIGGWEHRGDVGTLADLAGHIVVWRNDLRKLGYPEQVWRPLLIQYEEEELKLLIRERGATGDWEARASYKNREAFEKRLAQSLNDYRSRQNPRLQKVIRMGGCGAGEIAIHVQVRPSDGEVLFMPKLLYRYCQALRLDADNPRACNYWNRATDGILYSVSGTYEYWARWPDGQSRRGSVDFSKYRDQQTVPFIKP
jgi:hypothetical protein